MVSDNVQKIVAIDVGGTNARFAIAEIANGRVVRLDNPTTFATGSVSGLSAAWDRFAEAHAKDRGGPLPKAAALAVAAPLTGEEVRFTNSHWVIRPAEIAGELGLDAHVLINDFEAVGHAVAIAGDEDFEHLTGPAQIPSHGVTTIVGPGTGLGVAALSRDPDGAYRVLPTEGGHIGFAPEDRVEEQILSHVRGTLPRVSVERMCSGPAIVPLAEAIAKIDGLPMPSGDDRELWLSAMSGTDPVAVKAMERFCMILGAAAGDFALAHGSYSVVIAGGLGLRLKDQIAKSGFAERFAFKGRYKKLMLTIPVRLITHPQPGLLGAAAAFAQKHGR
ncbi:glucokinase [Croceicoccus naphthovorans]|uniref:Glucokinase n=1 Tax=Croceicoccus naphthovorans TaxID=1348774 RepID=A0A0G3XGT8_9SPHN|nr:glucokinase [Croceicoccus naphthovorans]AKM09558.1 glucokinase [Croceicoccus naphthovorans]MBB3989676.1 glucokinase [Croceicoccus naphthovorans]